MTENNDKTSPPSEITLIPPGATVLRDWRGNDAESLRDTASPDNADGLSASFGVEFSMPRGLMRNSTLGLMGFGSLFMLGMPLFMFLVSLWEWDIRHLVISVLFMFMLGSLGWFAFRAFAAAAWGRSRWMFLPDTLEIFERWLPGRVTVRRFARSDIQAVALYSNDPARAVQRNAWRVALRLADGSCPTLNLQGHEDIVAVSWLADLLADWRGVAVERTLAAPEAPNQPPPSFALWPDDTRRRATWVRRLANQRRESVSKDAFGFSVAYYGGNDGLFILGLLGVIGVAMCLGAGVACFHVALCPPGDLGEYERYRSLAWIGGAGLAMAGLWLAFIFGRIATARTRFLFEPERLTIRKSSLGWGTVWQWVPGDIAQVALTFQSGETVAPTIRLNLRNGESVNPLFRFSFMPQNGPSPEEIEWLARRVASWANCPLLADPFFKKETDADSVTPTTKADTFTQVEESARALEPLFPIYGADHPTLTRFLMRTLPSEHNAPPARGFAVAFGRSRELESLLRLFCLCLAAVACIAGWRLYSILSGAGEGSIGGPVIGVLIFGGLTLWLAGYQLRRRYFFAGQSWLVFEPGRLRLCDNPGWRRGKAQWRNVERDQVRQVELFPSFRDKGGMYWHLRLQGDNGRAWPLPGRGIGFGHPQTAMLLAKMLSAWSGAVIHEVTPDGGTPYPYGMSRFVAGSNEVKEIGEFMTRTGAAPFDLAASVIQAKPSGQPYSTTAGLVLAIIMMVPMLAWLLWEAVKTWQGAPEADLKAAFGLLLFVGMISGFFVWSFIAERVCRSDEGWLVMEPDRLRIRPAKAFALNRGAERVRCVTRDQVKRVEVYFGAAKRYIIRGWRIRLRLADGEVVELLHEEQPLHLLRREAALWLADEVSTWAGCPIDTEANTEQSP